MCCADVPPSPPFITSHCAGPSFPLLRARSHLRTRCLHACLHMRAGARRRWTPSAACRHSTTRRGGCCAAWVVASSRWSTTLRRPRPLAGRWRGAVLVAAHQRPGCHAPCAPPRHAPPYRRTASRRWTRTACAAWRSTVRCCGTASARWSWRRWRRRRRLSTASRPTPGACWATASRCKRCVAGVDGGAG